MLYTGFPKMLNRSGIMARKITKLLHGCYISNINVNPKNWNTNKATTTRDWYIKYRFYDPRFDKPKVRCFQGMNAEKDLVKRQQLTRKLLEQELLQLKQGYNPFEQHFKCTAKDVLNDPKLKYIIPQEIQEIRPDHSWSQAFIKAFPYLEKSTRQLETLKVYLRYTLLALDYLKLQDLPIILVKGKHMVLLYKEIKRLYERKWSTHLNNKYLSFFKNMFTILRIQEANLDSPYYALGRQPVPRNRTNVLTTEEITRIFDYCKEHEPDFYKFLYIFYHSGARPVELLRLKKENVDIHKGFFVVTVEKGFTPTQTVKAIHPKVVDLWNELYNCTPPNCNIFGPGFRPGKDVSKEKPYEDPYRRVKSHCKINKKMYSLKHHRMDQIEEYLTHNDAYRLAMETSKMFASHTSTQTGSSYATGREMRMVNLLKSIPSDI